MSRIDIVTHETANPTQKELLDAIQEQLGMVPNFLGVFAQSPEALQAFLGLHGIAGAGSLEAQTRERIAIAIAQDNASEYCVSAHTAIGRKAGLSDLEIDANRAGTSRDTKAAAAVTFAVALNENLGNVTEAEFNAVRAAGYSDAEIIEIITHVGMNILTNLLGKATQVDIDFPKISLRREAA